MIIKHNPSNCDELKTAMGTSIAVVRRTLRRRINDTAMRDNKPNTQ